MTMWCAAATIAAWPAGQAGAADLKLLSSWDKSNWPTYAVVDAYVKFVHADGAGKVKIAISGPEVVPPFEQLQPVSSGVFDMLYTHGVYHAGSKGIALVVDAIELDPYKRREAGIFDFVDKYYQKHNKVRLVSLPAAAFNGYHMYLKDPPTAQGDVSGRKIRGTQSYHGVIKALGGTPVVLPPAQIYTSLEKGVIDGACWPAAGMLTMKHYEVAKYALRPTFGTSNEPLFINVEKWNKLAKAEQDILLDAGKRLEYEMPWIGKDIYEKEEAELLKLGVKYVNLPPDKVALVKKTWSDSLWELAKQCCADGADDLKALATKAALTH
jgi:TRAP-type mannitol/chloroaromatic compound transport system substrate-binding protein